MNILLMTSAAPDKSNRSHLTKQAQKANITVASMTKITSILAGHQKQLNYLLALVSGNVQEDVKEPEPTDDLGDMYG